MSRRPNVIGRKFNCPSCDWPCDSKRGLSGHIAQTKECFVLLRARGKTSTARANRSARHRRTTPQPPPSVHPPPSVIVADDQLPNPPEEHPQLDPPRHQGVTLEEVEDEEPGYRGPRAIIDYFPYAGDIYPGDHPTAWETKLAEDRKADTPPWGSFKSPVEWDLAKWMATSGLSHNEMNKFLQLAAVS